MFICPTCGIEIEEDKIKEHLDSHFTQAPVPILKINSTPKKEVVEALIADVLSEMYKSFTSPSGKLTEEENLLSSLAIFCDELYLIKNALSIVDPRTLCPKHRSIQKVVPFWYNTLATDFAVLKEYPDDASYKTVARNMINIISDLHVMLVYKTKLKDRELLVKKWTSIEGV